MCTAAVVSFPGNDKPVPTGIILIACHSSFSCLMHIFQSVYLLCHTSSSNSIDKEGQQFGICVWSCFLTQLYLQDKFLLSLLVMIKWKISKTDETHKKQADIFLCLYKRSVFVCRKPPMIIFFGGRVPCQERIKGLLYFFRILGLL